MAKRTNKQKIGWEHPFVSMGFIPEYLLREVWPFSASYWETWLRRGDVPHRIIAGDRWFHKDQLARWFCNSAAAAEENA